MEGTVTAADLPNQGHCLLRLGGLGRLLLVGRFSLCRDRESEEAEGNSKSNPLHWRFLSVTTGESYHRPRDLAIPEHDWECQLL
jgi:hypothetical protein